MLPVKGAKVFLKEVKGKTFRFTIQADKRTLKLRAVDAASYQMWIDALSPIADVSEEADLVATLRHAVARFGRRHRRQRYRRRRAVRVRQPAMGSLANPFASTSPAKKSPRPPPPPPRRRRSAPASALPSISFSVTMRLRSSLPRRRA